MCDNGEREKKKRKGNCQTVGVLDLNWICLLLDGREE
jgi:hypothetical protein